MRVTLQITDLRGRVFVLDDRIAPADWLAPPVPIVVRNGRPVLAEPQKFGVMVIQPPQKPPRKRPEE